MNSGNRISCVNILTRHLQKCPLRCMLYFFAASTMILVSPKVVGQAAPHSAPSAPQPEKPDKKSPKLQHAAVEDASRGELLNIIDKQKKLISALEARVKELEQSAKPAAGKEHGKQ